MNIFIAKKGHKPIQFPANEWEKSGETWRMQGWDKVPTEEIKEIGRLRTKVSIEKNNSLPETFEEE